MYRVMSKNPFSAAQKLCVILGVLFMMSGCIRNKVEIKGDDTAIIKFNPHSTEPSASGKSTLKGSGSVNVGDGLIVSYNVYKRA